MDQAQNEGDTASFTCQAAGESVPAISWYFNGTLLVNGLEHMISMMSLNDTTINSILTIINVESSDVGTYTCNATNEVSSDNSSGVLTVNGELIVLLHFICKPNYFVTVPPNIATPTNGQFNIVEGSNGSITCTATGYPVPTVVWQNSDGSSLSNNRLVSGSPVISSTGVGNESSVSVELMVIRAMREDSGIYICSANNSVSSTTGNITIIVQCKYNAVCTNNCMVYMHKLHDIDTWYNFQCEQIRVMSLFATNNRDSANNY